jgi:hypothetical protein
MFKLDSPGLRPVLFALVVAFAAGCGNTDTKPGSPTTSSKAGAGGPQEPAYKLTAEALAKEALADAQAASAKYTGKVVELEGQVDSANRIISDNKGVFLTGAKKKPTDVIALNILCMPVESSKDKVWWLGKGHKVKAVGKVTAINGFIISLDECTITGQGASPTPKVTAEELTGEFAKDEEAAKKKYLGDGVNPKEIIVEGTVAALDKTKNDFYIARLEGKGGLTVGCTLDKKEWEGLKKGDKVTIKGDLSGFRKDDKNVNVNTAFLLKK